ncbi:MAG: hypothetical protein P1U69_17855 [Parvibaculaceae bacterium]|nr:hypothetical protein [Parvibaculaceae bacterium]HBM88218.1 hypothetical protein [Rhodobiaceae bacterium]
MARATSTEPVVLAILDGWGNRADSDGNGIANAKTPIFDRLAARGVRTMLAASGEAVGLGPDQPGNLEAGHRAIGAGRTEPQFAVRVNAAFAGDGPEPIADNRELQDLILKARSVGGAIHLVGLISPAGVEGHQYHLAVLAALMSHEGVQVWIHAILDGEDAGAQSGADCLGEFLHDIEGADNAQLVSVMGRRYAFDRLQREGQTGLALKAIVEAGAVSVDYAVPYIAECYEKGLCDADIPPAILTGYGGLRQDDALLLALLRADGAAPLMAALADTSETSTIGIAPVELSAVCSLTPLAYPLRDQIPALFEEQRLNGTLSEALATAGKRQLYISDEASPFALGAYQLCGRPAAFEGESHLAVPSPKRQLFEKKPDLAALDLANETVSAVKAGSADAIIVHFPNVGLAARTGDPALVKKAAEIVDKALGKITAILEKRGGTLMITASHGNAEDMRTDDAGKANARNTRAAVPLVIDGPPAAMANIALKPGRLADVAPTFLALFDAPQPQEMTGMSLLVSNEAEAHEAV